MIIRYYSHFKKNLKLPTTPDMIGISILLIAIRVEVDLVHSGVARRMLCSSWFLVGFCEGVVGGGGGVGKLVGGGVKCIPPLNFN